jgi:hypothetical protein
VAKIDPQKERERLTILYSNMSDLELEKVGKVPEALTEWARAALSEEMTKRGLEWISAEPLSQKATETLLDSKPDVAGTEKSPTPSRPVELRRYRDITEAMIDKSTLDSAGIESFLYDDNLIRMDWFISNAIGGVKLIVAENDAEEALKVLTAAVQENKEDVSESE